MVYRAAPVLVAFVAFGAGCGVGLDFDPPDPPTDASSGGTDLGVHHDLGGDVDAGTTDAGAVDAGAIDAGHRMDAGAGDGGMTVEAGTGDASASDGGRVEAGVVDGSRPDGGTGLDLGVIGSDAGEGGIAGPCDFVTTLVNGCTTDSDCRVAVHQTDCCGNSFALGINHSDLGIFSALEPLCDASYPTCGCPVGPTMTDTGETAFDTTTIQVACVSRGPRNVCLTYVTTPPIPGP